MTYVVYYKRKLLSKMLCYIHRDGGGKDAVVYTLHTVMFLGRKARGEEVRIYVCICYVYCIYIL